MVMHETDREDALHDAVFFVPASNRARHTFTIISTPAI